MRRRDFIALAGGAAVAWPLAARAQQAAMPTIGFLHGASPEPYAPMLAAFRQGLATTGYVEGRNVILQYRWAENRLDRLPELAAELVRLPLSALVVGGGTDVVMTAKSVTASIPIVFTIGSDPSVHGIVSSLARPEANVTGVTFFTVTLGPKRLELLRELVPKASLVAMLVHPHRVDTDAILVQDAARALGQSLRVIGAASEHDIDAAFRTLVQEKTEALLIVSNPLFTNRRAQIVALANHYRLPTVYSLREYVTAGGLMSYGASIGDAYRQKGVYAGRILNGEKPAELPVMQPTKFQLAINLRTAKALGIEIPPTLLARADEVIE
jgi:putative ABC transport system substrate-binding protein